MGCAGSKPPELIAQPKSDALIEGILSASVETTVKVPDCLSAKRFVLGKNVKLKGACVRQGASEGSARPVSYEPGGCSAV